MREKNGSSRTPLMVLYGWKVLANAELIFDVVEDEFYKYEWIEHPFSFLRYDELVVYNNP